MNHSDFPTDIEIRGEVFISNKDFNKIKDKFANPRNAASGSLRQKNPNETKDPIKIYRLHFWVFKNNNFKTIRFYRST